ncbi:MAG: universal stress protein [Bacteroidetes bacterium]|nr:universal stress protein [Bacteroidota bacterium]
MKTIIAGTDFTASSVNACRYAAMLAGKFGCKLMLFNLFEMPMVHSNSGLFIMTYDSERDRHERRMSGFIKRLERQFPKVQIENVVTTGSFKREINNLVKSHQIEAVIMGLASKTRINRYIYGSHSTDIAGTIKAPVIIVPETFKEHSLSYILLGVDNQEKLYKSGLRGFENFLRASKADLSLLHVRTPDELFAPETVKMKFNSRLYTTRIVEADDIQAGVASYVKEHDADMVAVISRRHSIFYNFFVESHTKKIAFSSRVPVMSIHE